MELSGKRKEHNYALENRYEIQSEGMSEFSLQVKTVFKVPLQPTSQGDFFAVQTVAWGLSPKLLYKGHLFRFL